MKQKFKLDILPTKYDVTTKKCSQVSCWLSQLNDQKSNPCKLVKKSPLDEVRTSNSLIWTNYCHHVPPQLSNHSTDTLPCQTRRQVGLTYCKSKQYIHPGFLVLKVSPILGLWVALLFNGLTIPPSFAKRSLTSILGLILNSNYGNSANG